MNDGVAVAYPPAGERLCEMCVNCTDNPALTFSQVGSRLLCSECVVYLADPPDRSALLAEWVEIMEARRGKGNYDFALAYSGGADSTAALKLLTQTYGLRVLAFTINNGMKTETVWENAARVSRHLGADWLYIHDYERSSAAIVGELREGSHVCGAVCEEGWKLPNYHQVMKDHGLDCVLTGLEIPTNGSIRSSRYPYMIKFMAAHLMSKPDTFKFIDDLPWENPGFEQGFDTDCLGAGFGLELYRRRHGTHAPVVIEFLAPRVRFGLLDREEELARLNVPVPDARWEWLEERFGPVRNTPGDVPVALSVPRRASDSVTA